MDLMNLLKFGKSFEILVEIQPWCGKIAESHNVLQICEILLEIQPKTEAHHSPDDLGAL